MRDPVEKHGDIRLISCGRARLALDLDGGDARRAAARCGVDGALGERDRVLHWRSKARPRPGPRSPMVLTSTTQSGNSRADIRFREAR